MATKFLEPGGDADFQVTSGNGFWASTVNSPTAVTDFVHGHHVKSIKSAGAQVFRTPNATISDAGARVSFYIYIATLSAATDFILSFEQTSGTTCFALALTSGGVLRVVDKFNAQYGTDGPTLSTGVWYRVSCAYTVTSTTVNRIEVFVNSVSAISITNVTLSSVTTSRLDFGNNTSSGSPSLRYSDIYVDDSNSLTDTGDIWVTAKRPFSNGTTNGFTTQIGSGGSGYGSGNSQQVNERPLSTTNGWSMIGAGSAVIEEYNIESSYIGDFEVAYATIVDWIGWASMSALAGETVQLIVGGANFSTAITSSATIYTAVKGSSTYPAGSGSDIGITTDTSLTTVSLYECGILVAFIPPLPQDTAPIPTVSQPSINYYLPAANRYVDQNSLGRQPRFEGAVIPPPITIQPGFSTLHTPVQFPNQRQMST